MALVSIWSSSQSENDARLTEVPRSQLLRERHLVFLLCFAVFCAVLLCFALLCSTLFCCALLFFTLLCSSLHSTPASTPASSVLVQCLAGDAVVDLADGALKSIRLLSSLLLGRGAR